MMWGGCRSDALEQAQLLAAIHASTLDVGCPTTREDSPSPSPTAVGSEARDLAECGAQSDMCLAAVAVVGEDRERENGAKHSLPIRRPLEGAGLGNMELQPLSRFWSKSVVVANFLISLVHFWRFPAK